MLELRRKRLLAVLTEEFHVSAERDHGNTPLSLAILTLPDHGSEPDRECFSLHVEKLGEKEVSQLMDDHQRSQNNEETKDRKHQCCPLYQPETLGVTLS